MATKCSSSYFLLSLATFFLYLTFSCSAYSKSSSSTTIASAQIKYWFENVENEMPNPILNKLSPLTQNDSQFFTNSISNYDKFLADANFCSHAKLACKSVNVLRADPAKAYVYGSSDKTKQNEDPFSFFRLSILKKGNLVHLPNMEESLPNRAFLPSPIASKISIKSINDISKIFPQSVENEAGKETIKTTLFYCNAESIKGESKSCPKSLEEMISFARLSLGGEKLISLSSKTTKLSNPNVIVKNIKEFKSDKIVACHEVFLPFATYFCHSFSSTNLYVVDFIEQKTGAPVNSILAACHMDTSKWPTNHVAFQILKSVPGQGEACHWFSQLDLAWVNAQEGKLLGRP